MDNINEEDKIINDDDVIEMTESVQRAENLHRLMVLLRGFSKVEYPVTYDELVKGLNEYDKDIIVRALATFMLDRRKYYQEYVVGRRRREVDKSKEKGRYF